MIDPTHSVGKVTKVRVDTDSPPNDQDPSECDEHPDDDESYTHGLAARHPGVRATSEDDRRRELLKETESTAERHRLWCEA